MRQARAEAITRKAYMDAQHEWKRLVKDSNNRIEFDTTLHYLNEVLPKKGKILDAGGGPGRYSIHLARKRYRPTILDLSAPHIEFARKQARREGVSGRFDGFAVGSILDLSRFPNNTFDAVLCLGGPLSHVSGERNRMKALSELVRVAKKNAPILVSVMGKWGTLATPLAFFANEARRTRHMMELTLKGEDKMWHGKYYSHYFTLDEVRGLFSKIRSIKVLKIVGLQGLSTTWSDKFTDDFHKDKKAWKNWMEIHRLVREVPSVVDNSRHILIVARKIR